jgi:UDP-N-acetylmuramoylalanine--D-glutamate ligase
MVLNRDDARSLAAARPGRQVVTFGLDPPPRPCDYGLVDGCIVRGATRSSRSAELKLVGRHNAANAMAALALCEAVGIDPHSVLPALAAFTVLRIASSGSPKSMVSATSTTRKGPMSAPLWRRVQGLGRRWRSSLAATARGRTSRLCGLQSTSMRAPRR